MCTTAGYSPICSTARRLGCGAIRPIVGRETIRQYAPKASGFTNRKGFRNRPLSAEQCRVNRTRSKVRAKVEYPFLVIKRIFGFTTVRYRGLEKNATRLFVTCALANVYLARR